MPRIAANGGRLNAHVKQVMVLRGATVLSLTSKLMPLTLLGAALSGCASQSHPPAPDASVGAVDRPRPTWTTPTTSCDPLAAQELPTQLGMVIAAGKDEQGTLYVVDRNPAESGERVFVSRGETLYRKRVSGSGSTGTSDFTWSFDDDGTPERLVVHKQGDTVTEIALAPPDERTFVDQLDDRAQKLAPVDPSSVTGLAVRNLPGEIVVEFVADAPDGSRLIVTRPMDDWTYDDFRIFYGINGHLLERVTTFNGALSYRAFDFVIDGATWHVIFASMLNPAIESAIDTGTASIPLTLVDPPVVSPNDSFECFVR